MEEPDQECLNILHSTLAHTRRRLLLYYLDNVESPQTLPNLAEFVAEREAERQETEIDAETVKNVYMSLYHVHVPVLEDSGLVEYDQEEDVVTLEEYPDDFINESAFEDR